MRFHPGRAIFPLLLVFFLAGCATIPVSQKKTLWPDPPSWTEIWYLPVLLTSDDEAIGTLKNYQNRMLLEGKMPVSTDVDRYGFRARLSWIQVEKGGDWVPYSGGVWIGWDYVPVMDTIFVPKEKRTPKEKTIIIPFKEIRLMRIFDNNQLAVTLLNDEAIVMECRTMQDAKTIADALFTLASALGVKRKARPGMYVHDLSPEQKMKLSLDGGVLVFAVTQGGPAEKAGVRFLDVIREINGTPIPGAAEFSKAADATADGGSMQTRLLRWNILTDGTCATTEISMAVGKE